MAYPYDDSAYDYSYTVNKIDPLNEIMQVTYSADDSDKPDFIFNISFSRLDLQDSTTIHDIIKGNSDRAHHYWRVRALAQLQIDSDGWSDSSFVGQTFTARHKRVNQSALAVDPTFNRLTHFLGFTDSENNDEWGQKPYIQAYTDSEKANFLRALSTSPIALRRRLDELGRLDSLQSYLDWDTGSDSDQVRMAWEYEVFEINAKDTPLAERIKEILNLNDSDFGQIVLDAGIIGRADFRDLFA